jgi:uncharacterized membrane protein
MKHAEWPAFDLIKCLCVIGMVLVHGFYWTWTMHGRFILPAESAWSVAFKWGMFLGICPLMLPFLAGAALRLRLSTQRPDTEQAIEKKLARLFWQCLILAALGYVMNVLAASWYVFWAWNVLQLVAVSFLIIGCLYVRWSIWPVAALGVLVLVVSDPLRNWIVGESRCTMLRVILGDPSEWHQWPIFPWTATVAFGFVLADAYFRLNRDRFVRLCTVAGVLFSLVAAALGRILPVFDPENLIGSQLTQPPAVTVLGLVGLMLLAFGGLTAIQDRLHLPSYGLVRSFSGGILVIYVVHMVIGVRLHELIFSHIDHAAVVNELGQGWHPFIMIGFPLLLLLLSWGVGYLTIRWLYGKRFSIRLRKVALSP